MTREIKNTQTPEELELEQKLRELSSLENEIAQKELDLATLTAELQALESRYTRIVGVKFLELDQVKAEIAELLAERQPEDENVQADAQEARARAEETARETGDVSEPRKVEAFQPTKEIRDLYRMIAKKIHPDLGVDGKDRERRTKIMAEVNNAYEESDVERLEAILREWEGSPEAVEGEGVGVNLVRTIRKIAQVKGRLQVIGAEFERLMKSELFELKTRVEEAKREGRDLFTEMATQLDLKIEETRKKLDEIERERAV